ncbi:MAG TPA: hypothetical protein PKC18_10985, partial [Lacipirellulaceae bacterium]|nr:hypothetical protein [Lacipirellulaceae bacterium]
EKAGVVVGERQKRDDEGEWQTVREYAGAHDFRRAFGVRWARQVMPTVLRELMRHATVETTMRYYVGVNAEATADEVWRSREGNKLGNTKPDATPASNQESTQTLTQ